MCDRNGQESFIAVTQGLSALWCSLGLNSEEKEHI